MHSCRRGETIRLTNRISSFYLFSDLLSIMALLNKQLWCQARSSRTRGCVPKIMRSKKSTNIEGTPQAFRTHLCSKTSRVKFQPYKHHSIFLCNLLIKPKIRAKRSNDHVAHYRVDRYTTNSSYSFKIPQAHTTNWYGVIFKKFIDWDH